MRAPRRPPPAGFSLVEVIVAMVILSIGLLAMAATTGYVFNRLRASGYDTERVAAVREVTERLRSLPYDEVTSRDPSQPDTVREFRFWWTVQVPEPRLKRVILVSEGPGYGTRGWTDSRRDTFAISIFEP